MPSTFSSGMPAKPVIGLGVILFVATLVGGWLYVENVKHGLEAKIEMLETRPAAGTQNGWHRVVSGKHGYTMQLPPGYHFLEGTDDERLAYVLPDPNENDDNPPPVMTVTVTDINDKEARSGHRVRVGDTLYWLSLWQGEDWEPYDHVVKSFFVL